MRTPILLVATALVGMACQTTPSPPQAEPEPATSHRADVAASQLPPSDSSTELDDQQLEQVVHRARESIEVAEVLSTSAVTEIVVQAGDGEVFGAERIAWVVFAFDEPHDPGVFPWDGMCDIGGSSEDWLGIVARVNLGDGDAQSSPLWTTGANCMSWFPGDQMPFEVEETAASQTAGAGPLSLAGTVPGELEAAMDGVLALRDGCLGLDLEGSDEFVELVWELDDAQWVQDPPSVEYRGTRAAPGDPVTVGGGAVPGIDHVHRPDGCTVADRMFKVDTLSN